MINLANPSNFTISIPTGAQSVYSLVSSWPLQLPAGSESLAVATTARLSANLNLAGGALTGGTW